MEKWRNFSGRKLWKKEAFSKKPEICNEPSFVREGLLRVYVDQPDGEVTQWIATPLSLKQKPLRVLNRSNFVTMLIK